MSTMKLKVKELRNLPVRDWSTPRTYGHILVIPSGRKHDSGYALMCIIGVNGEDMEIAAHCDDICWHLNGAGNYDLRNDMYYPSGVLRFWSYKYNFTVGDSLSSTDVTLTPKIGE